MAGPRFSGIPLEDVEQEEVRGGPRFSGIPLENNAMAGSFVNENDPNLTLDVPVHQDVPEKGAAMTDLMMSSFADDPMKRAQYLAKKRFPDEPNYGISRYRMTPDGDLIYRDKDGNWYNETPTMTSGIAGEASRGIPMVSGTAAGIASAPLWLAGPKGAAGSVALTSGAGGLGEYLRQKVGEHYLDDPVSYGDVALETGFGAAAELGGGMATRFMGRNVADDIARMNSADVSDLAELSAKHNISLTPAELTNLSSLRARQKGLSNLQSSMDQMMDFYRTRMNQVSDRVSGYLDEMSPIDSGEVAGVSTRDAAKRSIKDKRRWRSERAKKDYAFVNDPDTLVSDDGFMQIADDKYLAKMIEDVKSDDLVGMESFDNNSLPVLDEVKKRLDGMIGKELGPDGDKNLVRLLKAKRQKLIDVTDNEFPEYEIARLNFAGDSPEVDALEKGLVGIIAKLKDTKAQTAARTLFAPGQSGPQAVRIAKEAIKETDPGAWQAIKRSYIEDMWLRSQKEFATTGENINAGAKFRAMVFGDKRQAKILREALEPDELETLEEIAKVLEASGRVKNIMSDTAWNQEMMKLMRDEAVPSWAKAFRILRPQDWGQMLENWAVEGNLRKNATNLADIITNPGAMESLKELRQVKPNSARAAMLVSHALGITALYGGEEVIGTFDGDPDE